MASSITSRLLLLLCSSILAAQTPPANYDESNVGTYTLPDPLVFNNGAPVRSSEDWDRRRSEIVDLFADNVYGRRPKPPGQIRYEMFDNDAQALGGKAIRRQASIYFSDTKTAPKQDVLLYVPAHASKPVPVILLINFNGNQSISKDPGIRLATVWDRKTHEQSTASEASRGSDREFDLNKVLARGYAFATVCYQDIEPDFNGGIVHGIRPLFFKSGQTQPAGNEWGAIGAWSYGLSRVMDYLEKEKLVDAKRVVLIGHSRLGKTVLWTSGVDPRFAVAIASCSGEGGASLARRNYGETLRNLVDVFPYWFASNFAKYAHDPNRLPVDAHELIALSAPRPVYVTGAEADRWADPKGEFLACVGAGPVYRLLGKQPLGTEQMPALNQPIMQTIGFHYRTGGHAVTAYDWDRFLDFADMHLAGRQVIGR